MKNRIKKSLSLLLAVIMLLGTVSVADTENKASAAGLTLQQLQAKFPNGKYWNHAGNPGSSNSVNNQNGYTSTPCSVHGVVGTSKQTCNGFAPSGTQLSWQCMGYAEKLGYDATGYNPRNNANGWYTYKSSSALNSLKPGDIVRYKNDGHSIYVTAVNGETITYTDCNSDGHCKIRWGATISKSTLRSSFTHVRSAPNEVSGSISHTVNSSYGKNFTCYPKSKITAGNIFDANHNQISSTAWIGTSDKCTIHEVYTDGCCKVSYPLDSGGTKTVYSKISLFNTHKHSYSENYEAAHPHKKYMKCSCGDWYYTGATTYVDSCNDCWDLNRVDVWVSKVDETSEVSEGIVQNQYQFWFKLANKDTGALYNSYGSTRGYKSKISVYNPDGSELFSYTYDDSDYNWIRAVPKQLGDYKVRIELSGNITADYYEYFTVKSDVKLYFEDTSTLTVVEGQSKSFKAWVDGNWPDGTTVDGSINTKIATAKLGQCEVTITGVKQGLALYVLSVYDANKNVIASKSRWIKVIPSTYTITYNANGGSGAPSSQKKDYGKAITLSSAKPTRSGYTFLGWSTSSSATSATYKAGATYSANSNATLYAVWKSNTCSHSYNTGKITTAATCKSTGVKTYTCTRCGATKTETVAKNPANHAGGTKVKNARSATCTAKGYTGDTYCLGCGVVTAKGKDIAIKGHTYNTGKITTAATCKSTGVKTYTCTVCKATKTETIAKNPSNHTSTALKNATVATCTAKGYTGDTYCLGCGVITVKGKEIPAKGHTDSDNDGKCDTCGQIIGTPAKPDTPDDLSQNCSCACHKSGIAKLFFKIKLFFQKIFKTNKVCSCGSAHY